MVEHASSAADDISKDLFVASSANTLSHRLMLDKHVIEEGWNGLRSQPGNLYANVTYLPGGQRRHVNAQKLEEVRRRSWQARLERFWVSIFGGIALIAPMLLMALHNDRTPALATTSDSVLLFAIIIAVLTPAPLRLQLGQYRPMLLYSLCLWAQLCQPRHDVVPLSKTALVDVRI